MARADKDLGFCAYDNKRVCSRDCCACRYLVRRVQVSVLMCLRGNFCLEEWEEEKP